MGKTFATDDPSGGVLLSTILKRRFTVDFINQMIELGKDRQEVMETAIRVTQNVMAENNPEVDPDKVRTVVLCALNDRLDEVFGGDEVNR